MIILASSSPRRKELIEKLGISFTVKVKDVEERIDEARSVAENVKVLALLKASAVACDNCEQLVIGADTVVSLDGKIMGKPCDEEEAKEMLRALSGRVHEVCTGVALVKENVNLVESFCEVTKVRMKKLSEEEIERYVYSKEPMDKAGAYGIQGLGSIFVEGIEGDYFNVVGLPLHHLYQTLCELNLYEV